jgi:hypothetical protein
MAAWEPGWFLHRSRRDPSRSQIRESENNGAAAGFLCDTRHTHASIAIGSRRFQATLKGFGYSPARFPYQRPLVVHSAFHSDGGEGRLKIPASPRDLFSRSFLSASVAAWGGRNLRQQLFAGLSAQVRRR